MSINTPPDEYPETCGSCGQPFKSRSPTLASAIGLRKGVTRTIGQHWVDTLSGVGGVAGTIISSFYMWEFLSPRLHQRFPKQLGIQGMIAAAPMTLAAAFGAGLGAAFAPALTIAAFKTHDIAYYTELGLGIDACAARDGENKIPHNKTSPEGKASTNN
eukprot:TRINITY_DN6422_c0_g1_i2.p1 TRINITY_DN6422_c0_g1~~TRINITY_DN6422_c0_g1_i2.p1  ORF type:complete len:159 (-),score=30.31 TRINITY_DN6422_c0_g1_i2:119-595(-)